MKTALSLLAAASLLGLSTAGSLAPAHAEQIETTSAAIQEFSAAKKKKKPRSRVHVYRPYYGSPYAYAPRYYRGDDPMLGSEMRFRRSIGQCVIDLGYGRFESCNYN